MDQAGSAHRVVIVVGGFAGLYAAKALKSAPVEVTLVDRRNFHLFQPLLYQVATGALSPGEIASPLRFVLRKHKNTRVLLGEVVDLDPARRTVALAAGGEVSRAELSYDTLVLATGSCPHHFGRQDWEQAAPGLKSIEDATNMRGRILLAFERAEREPDPDARRQWLTFVIVGGGPTGVELAGALAEIANDTLKNDFRAIDPSEARILILEGSDRVLPSFPAGLSAAAEKALLRLGARAITASLVTAVDAQGVTYRRGGQDCRIASRTVLWAAGVQASPLG
ncbi:MAG: NAD(P)/FAD-dependent oxidoreductase, partial [Acidobacteria bacterium]|nr:NAD(P)/FAD-dependent oxidoreductase [Acidobacteriota bacterium]